MEHNLHGIPRKLSTELQEASAIEEIEVEDDTSSLRDIVFERAAVYMLSHEKEVFIDLSQMNQRDLLNYKYE